MLIPWQFPDSFVRLVSITEQSNGYKVALASTKSAATCPQCGRQTTKKHSTYTRHIQDLPCANFSVDIHLTASKWRCHVPTCSQRIFTERFSWLTPYARKTLRVLHLLQHFAFATSCVVAAKLAKTAGISVSHDTLLRLIYRTDVTPRAISAVIGIDEFAWRKGHTYGTIVCDFVTSRIVAVLPDRQPETISRWLKQHPHIQIVSRDGLLAFKEAIDEANPKIIQISDRWHFIKNCKKRLDDLLLSAIPSSIERKNTTEESPTLPLSKAEQRAIERKEQKKRLIVRVREAYQSGNSIRQLAHYFQLDSRTIKKYVTAGDAWLEAARRKTPHPFHARIVELETTRMTVESIRKARKLNLDSEQGDLMKRPQVSALLWKWAEQLTTDQSQWLAYVLLEYPMLKEIYEQVQTFRKAVEARDYPRFLTWLTEQLFAQNTTILCLCVTFKTGFKSGEKCI